MMNYKNWRQSSVYENQKTCIRTGNPAQNQDAATRRLPQVAPAAIVMALPVYADDPLATINALSDFVFSAIKAIGAILLGFGIVQIGLALKSHDAGQRAQGFMTFFGGVVIYFAKDILDNESAKKAMCSTCMYWRTVVH